MEESTSEAPSRAGEFLINISTDNVQAATQVLKETCTSVLYLGYETSGTVIETAVENDEQDDQEVRDIKPGSFYVRLRHFTDDEFLEVLKEFESGRMKERLQKEFSLIGIKVEGLRIENRVEVNETKEAINKRSEAVKHTDMDDVQHDQSEMKLPPDNEEALSEESSRSDLSRARAELLEYIRNSIEIGRSFSRVSILLVGTAGVGKSATVNHLLGIDLAETSETKSETRSTKEFVVKGNDPKYEVEGLSLGLVDTPGFCDTDGSKQEACNLLCMREFFRTHDTLSKCFPNLIFLIVKATDNRIEGENSQLGKALRCIEQFCLVDVKYPNVVVILTHVCSVRKKNDKEWSKALDKIKSTFKRIVFNKLKVDAPVVLIENKYEDCNLERRDDYTLLQNGEWQPRNLYAACADLLVQNNDNLGLITLNSIFVESKHRKPRIEFGKESEAKIAKECTLKREEETKVDFLKLAVEGGYKDPCYSAVWQYISEQKLQGQEEQEVMKIAGVLKHLCKGNPPSFSSHSIQKIEYIFGNKISSTGRQMLQNKFNIAMNSTRNFLETVRLIGQGYNILTDKSVAAQVIHFDDVAMKYGIAIPTCAKFEKVQQSRGFMEVFEDEKSYTQSRLKNLNVNLAVKPNIFKMDLRAGHNMKSDSTTSSSTSEYSFLFEQRLFELKIGNYMDDQNHGMTFTEDFKSDVEELPSKYNKRNGNCVSKFERFFDRFGHFLVSSAYGGGSVEVKFSRQAVEGKKTSIAEAKACLAATIDGLNVPEANLSADSSTSDSFNSKALLQRSTYTWVGGEVALQTNESIGDKERWKKWKESLEQNPMMLTSELTLEPISTAVNCVDPKKNQATYDALKDLLAPVEEVKKEKKGILDYLREFWERVKNVFTREGTVVRPYRAT